MFSLSFSEVYIFFKCLLTNLFSFSSLCHVFRVLVFLVFSIDFKIFFSLSVYFPEMRRKGTRRDWMIGRGQEIAGTCEVTGDRGE